MAEQAWVHLKDSRIYRKGDVSIEFADLGPAGPIRFVCGNRQIEGYVELISRGVAFWPTTLTIWSDGSPISESERESIVRELLDLSGATGIQVEIVR